MASSFVLDIREASFVSGFGHFTFLSQFVWRFTLHERRFTHRRRFMNDERSLFEHPRRRDLRRILWTRRLF